MNVNQKEADDKYKEGQKAITKSFFKLKFSADYLEGVEKFTDAAKLYKKLNLFPKSIEAFNQAIICNKKINDFFAAGNCFLEISEIYFFDLNSIENGIENLQKAAYQYKVAGKNQQAIKLYIDESDKFLTEKKYDIAERILSLCLKECEDSADNNLVRIAGEKVFTKFLDVLCGAKKFSQAIGMTDNYIKSQLKFEKKDMYKINQMYVKLAILRILNGEDYLVEDIISKMYELNYSDTKEDVGDLRKLMNSIKNLNKKDFTFCVGSCYTLFENNMLRGLQELYKKKEEEAANQINNEGDNNNVKNNVNNTNENEVKKNEENNTDSKKEDNNNENNDNNNKDNKDNKNPDDDFL
jgi:hypothetical protein